MFESEEGLRSTNLTLKQAGRLANKFLDGHPSTWDQTNLGTHLKVVWCGLIWENVDAVQKQYAAIAEEGKMQHHSTIFEWVKRWFELPWGTRHAYLVLFEEVKKRPRRLDEAWYGLRWIVEEYKNADK